MNSLALIALALAAACPLATSCVSPGDEHTGADAGDVLNSSETPLATETQDLLWPIESGVSTFVTQSAARSGQPFPCGSGVNAQHILEDHHGENHDYEHSLDIIARSPGTNSAPAFEGRGVDVVAAADGVVVAVSSVQSECERDLGAGNYVLVEKD